MNHKQKQPQKYPAGWDDRRVRAVIAHYESQTEDERVAEIEDKAIADLWRRMEDAIKQFNKTNRSKLLRDPKPTEHFGDDRFCLLNWCGQDDEGPFNENYRSEEHTS